MKILIVDDEYYTVEMLSREIDWNIFGITEVIKAYNGKEALEKILKEKPDILLSAILRCHSLTALLCCKKRSSKYRIFILSY